MDTSTKNNEISNPNSLFQLKVIPPTGMKFEKLEVKFEEPTGLDLFCCKVAVKSYSGHLSTEDISTDEAVRKLAPLFKYWIAEDQTVTLEGVSTKDTFHVTSASCKKTSAGFATLLVHRLLRDGKATTSLSKLKEDKLIRTEEEARVFYEICGHTLPKRFQTWFKDELEMLSLTSVDRDGRALAIKALSMVAAIDWTIRFVIPPICEVRKSLDKRLSGLIPVKEALLRIVARVRRTGKPSKYGICVVGPPGMGKTELALALAAAIQAEMIYIDLSTVHSGEDLDGTMRNYSNAAPGLVFQAMFRARTACGVAVLNEADKCTESSFSGTSNPTYTLLSMLDKVGLSENFLGGVLPMDGLIFVATANELSHLPSALLDRFTVIRLQGYGQDEKRTIWNQYIFPRALAEASISNDACSLCQKAEDLIFNEYATEPGVRDIEKYAEAIVDDYCLYESENPGASKQYSEQDIRRLLGPSKETYKLIPEAPGVVVGVAVIHDRVHTFHIEAAVRDGEGTLLAPGIFNPYQREYCRVAYEALRASSPVDLSGLNIILSSPDHLPGTDMNIIGAAALAAMWSAISGTTFNPNTTAFSGGVDLHGKLYWDYPGSIVPIVEYLSRNLRTLIAPPGSSSKLYGCISKNSNLSILEIADADTLMSLQAGNSHTH